MKTTHFTTACAIVALAVASQPAMAQSYGDDVTGGEGDARSERVSRGDGRVRLDPYIEASQVVLHEFSPGNDTVTYSQVAAGVDASVQGRNNGGSVSLRYERNFGWGDDAYDSDTVSGIARGYASVIPQAVTVEAGALASKTRVQGNGTAVNSPLAPSDSESRIYSAYAGPNVHTRAGDVEVNANYRFGYTKVEAPDAVVVNPGSDPVDVFDDSTTHSANIHLATRPGEPLPVGVGVGAGYYQEDISNLDQRIRDMHVRADVTVPVSQSLAVVGGVGYEDVEISARDAVLDTNGDPVIGNDGRIVTDSSAPRQLAYDVSGLIWDVGVVWRPSSRTAFEAHVGRRYDSTTYYGSFAWAPSSRSSFNVSVYDGLSGFGGQLNRALVALPTNFEANRNPITGDVTGCVASLEGGNCLNGALGSIRSAAFRSRGIGATYSQQLGRMSAGVGVGYDRRTFIAAPGTVLAAADGLRDESWYGNIFMGGEIGNNSSWSMNTYAAWFESDFNDAGSLGVGASAAYRRNITRSLSARAAVAYDHLESDIAAEDITAASALIGLRYDF